MSFVITPLTLREANQYVSDYHRHHKPVVGHRFSLAARLSTRDGAIVGTVVVGRPVARNVNQYRVAEVTRLTTDGTKNVCSFLYSAAVRDGVQISLWAGNSDGSSGSNGYPGE